VVGPHGRGASPTRRLGDVVEQARLAHPGRSLDERDSPDAGACGVDECQEPGAFGHTSHEQVALIDLPIGDAVRGCCCCCAGVACAAFGEDAPVEVAEFGTGGDTQLVGEQALTSLVLIERLAGSAGEPIQADELGVGLFGEGCELDESPGARDGLAVPAAAPFQLDQQPLGDEVALVEVPTGEFGPFVVVAREEVAAVERQRVLQVRQMRHPGAVASVLFERGDRIVECPGVDPEVGRRVEADRVTIGGDDRRLVTAERLAERPERVAEASTGPFVVDVGPEGAGDPTPRVARGGVEGEVGEESGRGPAGHGVDDPSVDAALESTEEAQRRRHCRGPLACSSLSRPVRRDAVPADTEAHRRTRFGSDASPIGAGHSGRAQNEPPAARRGRSDRVTPDRHRCYTVVRPPHPGPAVSTSDRSLQGFRPRRRPSSVPDGAPAGSRGFAPKFLQRGSASHRGCSGRVRVT
jgi:hypothetical protein